MILTIDVGNTNTVIGGFDENDVLCFESRISTDRYRMEDQYAITLVDILSLYGHTPDAVTGAIISSVVPPVTPQIKGAAEKVCHCRVLTVGPGIKTGLNIRIDEPASLGADMAAVAVGAKEHYPLPAVVIDLGTATKILAVDKTGAFVGGIIAPGIKISAEALAQKTASLPLIIGRASSSSSTIFWVLRKKTASLSTLADTTPRSTEITLSLQIQRAAMSISARARRISLLLTAQPFLFKMQPNFRLP